MYNTYTFLTQQRIANAAVNYFPNFVQQGFAQTICSFYKLINWTAYKCKLWVCFRFLFLFISIHIQLRYLRRSLHSPDCTLWMFNKTRPFFVEVLCEQRRALAGIRRLQWNFSCVKEIRSIWSYWRSFVFLYRWIRVGNYIENLPRVLR